MSANRIFKVKGKGSMSINNKGKVSYKYLTREVNADDKASAIINFLSENPEFSNSITCTYHNR